jgi:hypothetical protein
VIILPPLPIALRVLHEFDEGYRDIALQSAPSSSLTRYVTRGGYNATRNVVGVAGRRQIVKLVNLNLRPP